MARFILRALEAAFGFWVAGKLFAHHVHVGGAGSLIAAGFLLGIINALVRPILIVLTLPITILTLGLFLFAINGISVWMVTWFIHGVRIDGWLWSILTAFVISLVSWVANGLITEATADG